jgi:hypothetical protein
LYDHPGRFELAHLLCSGWSLGLMIPLRIRD